MEPDVPILSSRYLTSGKSKHEGNDDDTDGAQPYQRLPQQIPGSFEPATDDRGNRQHTKDGNIRDVQAGQGLAVQAPASDIKKDAWCHIASAEDPQRMASPEEVIRRMQRMSRRIDRRESRIRKLEDVLLYTRELHAQETKGFLDEYVKALESKRRAASDIPTGSDNQDIDDDHTRDMAVRAWQQGVPLENCIGLPNEAGRELTITQPLVIETSTAGKGKGQDGPVATDGTEPTKTIGSEGDDSRQRKAEGAFMSAGGEHLFVMARFRDFSAQEKQRQATKLDFRIDHEAKSIEVRPARKAGDMLQPGYSTFKGLEAIVDMEGDNGAVWGCCAPAFTAFTYEHPVCVLFDGYSGSGKSWTVFGKDGIAKRLARELWAFVDRKDWQVRVNFAARSIYNNKEASLEDRGVSDADDLSRAIATASQKRDRRNASTINNRSSSRSHLILEFTVTEESNAPWRSSFCLVDLAGAERELNEPTKGAPGVDKNDATLEDSAKAQDLLNEERKYINSSRSNLRNLLMEPTNKAHVRQQTLNKSLEKYLYIKKEAKRSSGKEPKRILFTLLSPLAEKEKETISTLSFIQGINPAPKRAKVDAVAKKHDE